MRLTIRHGVAAALLVGGGVVVAADAFHSDDRAEPPDYAGTPRLRFDPRTARVSGCVRRHGKPVPHASVGTGHFSRGAHDLADDDGCFELVIAPQDLARWVMIDAIDDHERGRIFVDVERGQTLEHADIVIGNDFHIRGVVRDEAGAPLPHASIRERTGRDATTDAVGRYELSLPPGRHRLHVFDASDGERPSSTPALVDAGELPASVDLDLVVGSPAPPRSTRVSHIDGARRLVPNADNAVDLGVELRDGGRVAGVAAEAKAAGLLPGDVIVAIDGIDVAGYEPHAIDALGFHVVPGHVVTWTIDRAGERRALSAVAPGAYAAPRYPR